MRVGAATIRFDAARFKATSASQDSAWFVAAEDSGAIEVTASAGAESCADLARRAFAAGPYDIREMETSAIDIGGGAGTRFAAHTRCRNATPRGEVVCVKAAGRTYLLTALRPGCRGNPFPRSDALGEIAAGVTLEPPR